MGVVAVSAAGGLLLSRQDSPMNSFLHELVVGMAAPARPGGPHLVVFLALEFPRRMVFCGKFGMTVRAFEERMDRGGKSGGIDEDADRFVVFEFLDDPPLAVALQAGTVLVRDLTVY